ncbi:YbgA family protein [Carnobacterium gallinarum]|uniref:YbgA family protein n=1 Tax=Carnobacterium gallinarum TaxID=2749 RepID=UPI00055660C7|nr:YbgA family protein [Carnobacterium gallinarum]
MDKQEIQIDWARSKYLVMAHSQTHYNQMRQLFKEQKTIYEFEEKYIKLRAEALKHEITTGAFTNTAQHMWGYFKKMASLEEKETVQENIQDVEFNRIEQEIVLQNLRMLAMKYQVDYLLNSYFLFNENPLKTN